MDELRELNSVPGIPIRAYKQSDSHIACKMVLTISDAMDLCNRTRSGLFKNKDFHEMFVNTIITELDKVIEGENKKIHADK